MLTQQAEFQLVAEVRKIISSVALDIKPDTADEYKRIYQRLVQSNQLPEDARSRSDFYRKRAALLYACSLQAKAALKARDKASRGSHEWELAIKEILRIKEVFTRYPPDPERKRKDASNGGVRWKDVKDELKASGWEPQKKSKRRHLDSLVRRTGWQDALLSHISPRHRDALALAILTGVRPSEIALGVQVKVTAEGLVITVQGAKIGQNRGQPTRVLLVAINCSASKHLASLASQREVTISTNPKRFSDAVTQAGRKAFPRAKNNVSPYSLRHAVASALKASGVDTEGIAMALGHRATASQQAYGRASHGKSETPILGVQAALPVVQTGSDPAAIGRRRSPTPRRR